MDERIQEPPPPTPARCSYVDDRTGEPCPTPAATPSDVCDKHLGQRSYVGPLSVLVERLRARRGRLDGS